MTVEIWIIGASWVTSIVAVSGVVLTWRKNGSDQAARDERTEVNQENIMKKLDDPTNGLTAINEKVNNMVNHCATVSTGLTERVRAAERDVKDLKQK